jgi:hypothetical protein
VGTRDPNGVRSPADDADSCKAVSMLLFELKSVVICWRIDSDWRGGFRVRVQGSLIHSCKGMSIDGVSE